MAPQSDASPDFRTLFESVPGLYLVLTPDFKIVAMSDAYCRATLTVRDKILGREIFDLFPDNPRDPSAAGTSSLRASLECVTRLRCPDAMAMQRYDIPRPASHGGGFEERYWSPLNTPVLDAKGRIAWIIHQVEDVSVRQRSEQKFGSLLESAPDAMVIIDRDGSIVFVNSQTETLFGHPRDELLGQKVEMLVPARVRDRHPAYRGKFFVDSRTRPMGPGLELYGLRRDGTEFPVEIMLSPLESAEGILVTAAIRDISVRKEAEKHLAQMEERYRGLLEAAPDAMVVVNQGGEIVLLNVQAEKQFGYRRDELLGQKVKNIIPEGFAERLISDSTRTAAEALAQQIGTGIELVGRRKDGSEFPIEIMLSPLDSAEGILVTAAIRDISERKNALGQLVTAREQLHQAQKMEAVGQLTGGLAHDFNNLLAIIVGGLDLLAERLGNDEKAQKLVEVALSAALRGADLTRKLLAFSRKQALETKTIGVNALVRDTMEMLRRSLGENMEVKVIAADDLWVVDTDPTQFESALVNLAVNSRDAMPDGGRLTIETANSHLDEQYAAENPDVMPGDYVMLAVTDTGVGISQENLDRVIEPFFTTKEIGKGSGLGLSMIYGFAKQSGGHLKIYSEIGHGTTARLYLPRGKARPEPGTTPVEKAAEPMAAGELILVVDDNAQVRGIVVEQLTRLGYHTLEAANGASAVDLLRTTPGVDLLFTDIVMPGGMSGIQLGEAARQIRPEIRILYTSGFTEASVRHETAKAIAAGQLLTKPYRKHELAEKLRRALSRL